MPSLTKDQLEMLDNLVDINKEYVLRSNLDFADKARLTLNLQSIKQQGRYAHQYEHYIKQLTDFEKIIKGHMKKN